MVDIDWYKHYTKTRKLEYNKETFKKSFELYKKYLQKIKKYIKPKSKILECGCGPAKTIIAMSHLGYDITAIDNDKKVLALAKENAKIINSKIKFLHMDFFDIDKNFEKDSFDCITHQGVLEHFPKEKIKEIITKQLKIAPLIIFSVPIKSEASKKKFSKDTIYRNMWTAEEWVKEILKDFKIKEHEVTKQIADVLIAVIER